MRIGHGFCVGSAQDFYPFFRRAWRHHPGPAKVAAAQNHVGDATALFRGLFFVEDFVDRWSLWNPPIPFLPAEEQHVDKVSFAPTYKGLAPEKRGCGHPAALHLSLFHREIDLAPARITQDGVDLQPESVFKQTRQNIIGPGSAGGTAFGRRAGLANVFHGFVGSVTTHVQKHIALFRRADPIEFPHVVLDLLATHELIQVQAVGKHAKRQTVRLRDAIHVVGGDQPTGTGHVLDDDLRVTWNKSRHVTAQKARPPIVKTAGSKSHHDLDRFTLVE